MNIFSQILVQIGQIFKKMSAVQRTNFIILSLVVVAFMAVVIIWAGRTEYSILYSNLSQRDAGSIKAKLDEMKIENRVEGNAIYVASKNVYETRLLLANEGLPQGSGVGYEIFNKNTFAMTDYMQQLNYKRALEGELARTINSLRGINGSRVHLALPKKGLFEEKESRPSASVILDLPSGFSLTKSQVQGIVHLVSSSVEDMSPNDVNVIDGRGNLLYGAGQESTFSGLTSTQLDAKQNVESYLEKKAESMLLTILGSGKAIVRVSADMNFDQVEKTEEKFDPEGAVARKEVKQAESTKSQGNAAAETGAGNSEKTQERTTTDYEVSRTVAKIVSSVGTVKKLKVAVVVSGTYKAAESAKQDKKNTAKKEYVPRSAEEKDMYKKLVMNAVGFDAGRGDEIEINDAAFDTSSFEEEQMVIASSQSKDFIVSLSKQAGTIVLFVLAFFFLLIMLKKVSAPIPTTVTTVSHAPESMRAAAAMAVANRAKVQETSSSAAGGGVRIDQTANEAVELAGSPVFDEIKVSAGQDIDATAGVLREWLKE